MLEMKVLWRSFQRFRVESKARDGYVYFKPVLKTAATPTFLLGSVRNREIATSGRCSI